MHFFACNTEKLRSYRARTGQVELVGRWSGKGRLLKMKASCNKGMMEGSIETQWSQVLFQDWLLRDLRIHTCDTPVCVIRNPTPRMGLSPWWPFGAGHRPLLASGSKDSCWLHCSGPACKEKVKFCLCVPQRNRIRHSDIFFFLQKYFEGKGRNCCNNGVAE